MRHSFCKEVCFMWTQSIILTDRQTDINTWTIYLGYSAYQLLKTWTRKSLSGEWIEYNQSLSTVSCRMLDGRHKAPLTGLPEWSSPPYLPFPFWLLFVFTPQFKFHLLRVPTLIVHLSIQGRLIENPEQYIEHRSSGGWFLANNFLLRK